MVGADPHGLAKGFALAHQWREFHTDARQFFFVGLVGVDQVLEPLLVRIVSGVDTDLFHVFCSDFCRIGGEVDVRHQWDVVPGFPQLLGDEFQSLGISFAGGGDAHQFTPHFDHSDALGHSGIDIQSVGGGHGLHPDRVLSTYADVANLHRPGGSTLVIEGIGAVGSVFHRQGCAVKITAGNHGC